MLPEIPLIRAAPVRAFVEHVRTWGAPVERLLDRVRLSPRVVMESDPETLVPLVAFRDLMESTARTEGDDTGMRLGMTLDLSHLGQFGSAVEAAWSLRDALGRAFGMWPTYNSGERSWITQRGDQVDLHHRFLFADGGPLEQGTSFALAMYLKLLARAGGPGWYPTRVAVPVRALPAARVHPLLANTRLEFGRPWTTITVPAALLDRPIPRRCADRVNVRPDWTATAPASDVGGAVRQVITAMLPDGYPDIHHVAESVGMSTRTLQRRLQQRGVTFASAVAMARFLEAQRLLRESDRKIIDVALDLGYSDPAHFTRAFGRWAGMTPREFRRRSLEPPPVHGGIFSTGGHVLGTRP